MDEGGSPLSGMCVGSLVRANQERGILESEALKHKSVIHRYVAGRSVAFLGGLTSTSFSFSAMSIPQRAERARELGTYLCYPI